MQLPYPEMPATTPSIRYRLRLSAGGPNRSEFSKAMGRAPMAKMSRTMPPTPVAAPSYGSMADGWLWDSIFITMASPSPMSTTPAFSAPWVVSSLGLSVANMRSSGLECL